MKDQKHRLNEDTAYEILELAARYYTQESNKEENKGYTVEELIDAGTEADIPDEYIQRAIKEVEAKKTRQKKTKAKQKNSRSSIVFQIVLAIGSIIFLKYFLFLIYDYESNFTYKKNQITLTNKAATAKNPLATVQVKALGDTFSGYSTLRNLKFQNALKDKDIQLGYGDEFDQQARAQAIDKGNADIIVTTLDQYLIHQPQGKIIGLIDRTVGADAIVFNNQAYPQLKSLLDLEKLIELQASKGKWLKIVFAKDTPSEFLATVLDTKFDSFTLSKLEIVEVEDASIAWEMMQQDSDVALGVLWEPYVSKAQSKGNTIALSSKDAPKTIVDVIVASDRIIAHNPEAVTEFISAYYQSIDSGMQDSSLLTHQIAIDGKMKLQEAKTVSNGIKFFSSLEAQQWMKTGILQTRIEAIAAILALAGKIDDIPADTNALFTAEYLTPAVERTNHLLEIVAADNPELAKKLQGLSTASKKAISSAEVAAAKPIGNLSIRGEVKFQTGSAYLTEESKAILATLKAEIAEFNPENIAIKVQGHTSKTGNAQANQQLSQQRAEVVVKQLQASLPHTFIAEGLGFSEPLPKIAPTSVLNQRTVIRLVRVGS